MSQSLSGASYPPSIACTMPDCRNDRFGVAVYGAKRQTNRPFVVFESKKIEGVHKVFRSY